jgi:hypothetical protein
MSEHIKHIFEDGVLLPTATVRLFRTVQTEDSRTVEREVEHYKLNMVLAPDYRPSGAVHAEHLSSGGKGRLSACRC